MAHVDISKGAGNTGQSEATAASDADIITRIFRCLVFAINSVVEISDGLAKVFVACDGCVLLVRGIDRDLLDSGRRVGQWPGFGRTLAKIGPFGIVIRETVGHGFVHDVDNACPWDETKPGNIGLFLCVQICALSRINLAPEASSLAMPAPTEIYQTRRVPLV